jgi:hypothetical protein
MASNQHYCRSCRRKIVAMDGQSARDVRIKKFCNKSCAAKYNNKKFPKRKPEGKCAVCGSPSTRRSRYCSNQCRHNARVASRQSSDPKARSVRGVTAWRKRLKLKAVEYKGGACEFCGYAKCLRSLGFHHSDQSQKDFSISRVTASWVRIKKELDKCVLTCANCHGEIHDGLIVLKDQPSPGGRPAPQDGL